MILTDELRSRLIDALVEEFGDDEPDVARVRALPLGTELHDLEPPEANPDSDESWAAGWVTYYFGYRYGS